MSSSTYWVVRTFKIQEVLGIFELSNDVMLSNNLIRAISMQLESESETVDGTVWFPEAITKIDFETYQAFGFKQYSTCPSGT